MLAGTSIRALWATPWGWGLGVGLLTALAAGVAPGRAGAQQVAPVQVLGLSPIELRTEYRVDPQGIDATAPRLSWNVGSSQRGQKQTAYQILVASDNARLARNEGDLWDTGKVAGDDTTGVAYAGKPLRSQGRYAWKVKVWDRDGKPSTWSAPAYWTIGLLKPEEKLPSYDGLFTDAYVK